MSQGAAKSSKQAIEIAQGTLALLTMSSAGRIIVKGGSYGEGEESSKEENNGGQEKRPNSAEHLGKTV